MSIKAWIFTIITYFVLCVLLILSFDRIWPDYKVVTKIVPLVVGALITHLIRKVYDFVFDVFNKNAAKPFLGVSISVDHASRKFIGYGASCGEIIQAGNFKANYEVEVELDITIQNESPTTIYEIDVSYTPNHYSSKYSFIDSRQNKLQPLEGNKHFDFKLRIMKVYYDVYVYEVNKDIQQIYKVGKGISLLNGSEIIVKYKDSKHKQHIKTEIIE